MTRSRRCVYEPVSSGAQCRILLPLKQDPRPRGRNERRTEIGTYLSVVYRLIVSHLLHIQGDTHRRARTHRPWRPADTPQYERQRQQPGSCEASTRQPSHPQRVGFASESASILCVQLDTRCADFGLQPMELGQGLRASLRTATCRSSSIRACRLREFRVSDLL